MGQCLLVELHQREVRCYNHLANVRKHVSAMLAAAARCKHAAELSTSPVDERPRSLVQPTMHKCVRGPGPGGFPSRCMMVSGCSTVHGRPDAVYRGWQRCFTRLMRVLARSDGAARVRAKSNSCALQEGVWLHLGLIRGLQHDKGDRAARGV